MANPPVLPPATTGAPGGPAPADWENWFGGILHGFNPGGAFSQGPPAETRVGPGGAAAPAATGKPDPQQAPGTPGPLSGEFWQRLLLDVEVYGFLLLLVAIGLYGLFAPQVNTIVQTAAKAATKGVT